MVLQAADNENFTSPANVAALSPITAPGRYVMECSDDQIGGAMPSADRVRLHVTPSENGTVTYGAFLSA